MDVGRVDIPDKDLELALHQHCEEIATCAYLYVDKWPKRMENTSLPGYHYESLANAMDTIMDGDHKLFWRYWTLAGQTLVAVTHPDNRDKGLQELDTLVKAMQGILPQNKARPHVRGSKEAPLTVTTEPSKGHCATVGLLPRTRWEPLPLNEKCAPTSRRVETDTTTTSADSSSDNGGLVPVAISLADEKSNATTLSLISAIAMRLETTVETAMASKMESFFSA